MTDTHKDLREKLMRLIVEWDNEGSGANTLADAILALLPARTPEADVDVVVWNEPLCLDQECVVNSVARATKTDVIRLWRHTHKEHTYTDEEALADFMAVHWAWFEPTANLLRAPAVDAEAIRQKDDALQIIKERLIRVRDGKIAIFGDDAINLIDLVRDALGDALSGAERIAHEIKRGTATFVSQDSLPPAPARGDTFSTSEAQPIYDHKGAHGGPSDYRGQPSPSSPSAEYVLVKRKELEFLSKYPLPVTEQGLSDALIGIRLRIAELMDSALPAAPRTAQGTDCVERARVLQICDRHRGWANVARDIYNHVAALPAVSPQAGVSE